MGFDHCLPAR